jgi:hypothetical protein
MWDLEDWEVWEGRIGTGPTDTLTGILLPMRIACSTVDRTDMPDLSFEGWVIFGAISLFGVTGFLYCLAAICRNECTVHDTKVRMGELKTAHVRRIQELVDAADRGMISRSMVNKGGKGHSTGSGGSSGGHHH